MEGTRQADRRAVKHQGYPNESRNVNVARGNGSRNGTTTVGPRSFAPPATKARLLVKLLRTFFQSMFCKIRRVSSHDVPGRQKVSTKRGVSGHDSIPPAASALNLFIRAIPAM